MAAAESSSEGEATRTSLSSSYGIVCHLEKIYVIVNAGFGDPVDVLLEMKTSGTGNNMRRTCQIQDYYEGINKVLHGYKTVGLIFTESNGSVVSARYLYYNRSGELVSIANIEGDAQRSMRMARYVLWCDYVRNDLPNAIRDAVETGKSLGKENKEEEICVICLKEYQAEDMIGTLRCKHSYHDDCIKKWLRKTIWRDCPICRDQALHLL